jgi:hypothetical protein
MKDFDTKLTWRALKSKGSVPIDPNQTFADTLDPKEQHAIWEFRSLARVLVLALAIYFCTGSLSMLSIVSNRVDPLRLVDEQ